MAVGHELNQLFADRPSSPEPACHQQQPLGSSTPAPSCQRHGSHQQQRQQAFAPPPSLPPHHLQHNQQQQSTRQSNAAQPANPQGPGSLQARQGTLSWYKVAVARLSALMRQADAGQRDQALGGGELAAAVDDLFDGLERLAARSG